MCWWLRVYNMFLCVKTCVLLVFFDNLICSGDPSALRAQAPPPPRKKFQGLLMDYPLLKIEKHWINRLNLMHDQLKALPEFYISSLPIWYYSTNFDVIVTTVSWPNVPDNYWPLPTVTYHFSPLPFLSNGVLILNMSFNF